MILRALLDGGYLHGACLTVRGQTLAESVAAAPAVDGKVVRTPAQALSPNGGLVVLKGNLCPDGALIKVATKRIVTAAVLFLSGWAGASSGIGPLSSFPSWSLSQPTSTGSAGQRKIMSPGI